jgi:hypothetical protein
MESMTDYAASLIIFLGSIQIIVLNFLAFIGAFTLWSWVFFQLHCLKLARAYQKAKIEHENVHVDFVTAFWYMKNTYKSHQITEVRFNFEKTEDENVK